MRDQIIVIPIFRWRNWSMEKFRSFVSGCRDGKAGIRAQGVWCWVPRPASSVEMRLLRQELSTWKVLNYRIASQQSFIIFYRIYTYMCVYAFTLPLPTLSCCWFLNIKLKFKKHPFLWKRLVFSTQMQWKRTRSTVWSLKKDQQIQETETEARGRGVGAVCFQSSLPVSVAYLFQDLWVKQF